MNLGSALVIVNVLILNFTFVVHTRNTIDNVVCTSYGRVSGILQRLRSNREFLAFKGIPFASPPVGELRFRAPVPPPRWEGIRPTKQDMPMCIQKNYMFHERPPVEGEEDCLYLNVYKPVLLYRKRLLPVMVFIHFGGFFAGTGNSDYVGPEYFMSEDVILVTFNYRLGVFGFLSTLDDAAPGNWGLKDQVFALKWVQRNIEYFGGDRNNVTIFGQSAGGASVHYHLLSPRSKNLFHRAISQSGSALAIWARANNSTQKIVTQMQAGFVGCPSITSMETIKCLRRIDANVLADSADLFKTFSTEPYAVYQPVIEVRTKLNKKPFIEEDPLEIIKAQRFHNVPWIVGIVEDEGILRAAPILRQNRTLQTLNANFDTICTNIFGIPLSVAPSEVITTWNRIRNFYLGSDSIDVMRHEQVQGFINLYSDRAFIYGSYQAALLHAWKGHTPIWFYRFAYRGEYSYGDLFAATAETIPFDWGVSHADDLLYLFPSKKLLKPITNYYDKKVISTMTRMWSDFAATGNPVGSTASDPQQKLWKPLANLEGLHSVGNNNLTYLYIYGNYDSLDSEPISFGIRHEFEQERISFWESLPLKENIPGIH